MKAKMTGWTFGAEHEWGDWHYNGKLPPTYGRDVRDYTCMSSNGIGNDPKGKSYAYGGEINTPPYDSPRDMAQGLQYLTRWVSAMGPAPTVNHRSNLHIHIRVPGLKDDLSAMKQVQAFIHEHMRDVLKVIQPLPKPMRSDGERPEAYAGALRRWRRRRVSHQTLLTSQRLQRQLAANTIEEFFQAEVPQSWGKPQWHLQPRLCVNLRQLLETDTVEFRHFAGTLDANQLEAAARYCEAFMKCALLNDAHSLFASIYDIVDELPTFPNYVHYLECRYRATCHDGTLKRPEIEANIQRILKGEFDEYQ
jgi:hypothetical protein